MHGVTGRMGMNQHLIRSIVAIRAQGGVVLSNGDRVMPDPILIGRNAEKIAALAKAHGIERWSTDLDQALKNKDDTVFFDAGTTQMRPALLAKAIRAGKHVYCEKPIATNLNEAVEIARLAQESGVKHGAVQDKLFLPGLRKIDMLRRAGFFGRMLVGAAGVRLLGVRGRPAADPAPELELPQGRRRRDDPGHDVPLALRAGQPVRRSEVHLLHRRDAYSAALGRVRQTLPRDGRRCRLCHGRTGRPQRRAGDRADEHVLGDARAPRRPGDIPRRRHAWLGGGRPERLPRADRA